MEAITIPHIHIPSIDIGGICLPGIGVPDGGKKGLVWPAGLKESIKAIYDPAKQGMTNYDVIEAYIEDFTGWEYRDYRGTAKITNNAIVITNVVETNNIVEDAKEPYSDLTIRVTGVTEDKYLIVRQGRGRPETHIKKDGIYIFPNNNLYFGFAVNKTGDCNITITQLPTSILKDLSGNGNHAYLYGGKGKLNSGVGIYSQDFTSYEKKNSVINSFTAILSNGGRNNLLISYNNLTKDIEPYNVNIKGIVDEYVAYFYRDKNGIESQFRITEDGIYTLPKCYKDGTTGTSTGFVIYNENENSSATITQIPDYPNQLCYDGSMYAVCYGFPILTDYTVIADRTWFSLDKRGAFSSKSAVSNTGAFIFEFNEIGQKTFSYGNLNSLSGFVTGITYQTKNSYNKEAIKEGNITDTDELIIGTVRVGDFGGYVGCHGKIIIADRSFTEDEITWLKDNWKKI